MKLMWFHLMPYTELPDDFPEKNPSVWVDIHSSLFDRGARITCTTTSWTSSNTPPSAGSTRSASTSTIRTAMG